MVVSLEGDLARIQIEPGTACESCGARLICAPGRGQSQYLTALNRAGARVGERVVVEESGNLLLKLSLLQYGLPLAGFLGGLFVFQLSPARANDLLLFVAGIVGLTLAGLLARLILRRMSRQPGSFLYVARVVPPESAGT